MFHHAPVRLPPGPPAESLVPWFPDRPAPRDRIDGRVSLRLRPGESGRRGGTSPTPGRSRSASPAPGEGYFSPDGKLAVFKRIRSATPSTRSTSSRSTNGPRGSSAPAAAARPAPSSRRTPNRSSSPPPTLIPRSPKRRRPPANSPPRGAGGGMNGTSTRKWSCTSSTSTAPG